MKKMMKIFVYSVGLLISLLTGWHLVSGQTVAEEQNIPSSFKGSFLAISDADMIATAYANGIINKAEGIEDSLMHISLNNNVPYINSKINASNSVISWPAILEWHPQKKYVYVAETRASISPENTKMKNVFEDFPKGKKITVYDYQNSEQPVLVQELKVGNDLQNVTINAQGDLLAAGNEEKGKEIFIATLKEGLIDQTFYFSDEEINYEDSQDGGIRTIEFHPKLNVFAVNLNGKSVAFYEVLQDEGKISVSRLGKSLEIEKKLSVGNWHPSGKYFMVANVNWGSGALGAIFNNKGHLINIRFDTEGNHQIVSKVKVGLSPEGFDVSPDGKYAVAVNMRRTYGPKQFWFVPGTNKASLSLVKINENTGELQVIGKQYGFEGVLPEDAIFDKDSNSLAVAVYHDQ